MSGDTRPLSAEGSPRGGMVKGAMVKGACLSRRQEGLRPGFCGPWGVGRAPGGPQHEPRLEVEVESGISEELGRREETLTTSQGRGWL